MKRPNRFLPIVFILGSMMAGWFLAVRIWTDKEEPPVALATIDTVVPQIAEDTLAAAPSAMYPRSAFDVGAPNSDSAFAMVVEPENGGAAPTIPSGLPPAVEFQGPPLTAFSQSTNEPIGTEPTFAHTDINTPPGMGEFHPPVAREFRDSVHYESSPSDSPLTESQRKIIEKATPEAIGFLSELTVGYDDVCISPAQAIILKRSNRVHGAAIEPDINVGVNAITQILGETNSYDVNEVCRDPAAVAVWAPAQSPGESTTQIRKPVAAVAPAIASCWPRPIAIEKSLEPLREVVALRPWIEQLDGDFDRLAQLTTFHDPQTKSHLAALQRRVHEGWELSQQTDNPKHAITLQRAAYAITRRLETWNRVHLISVSDRLPASRTLKSDVLAERIVFANHDLNRIEHAETWRAYLLFVELYKAIEKTDSTEESDLTNGTIAQLARKSLARFEGAAQLPAPRKFFSEPVFTSLRDELKKWATDPVDFREVLRDIETYELTGETSAASRVSAHYQTLRWSPSVAADLSSQIETRYRDANVCFQVSGDLLNRYLPPMSTFNAPIANTIAGADVRGQSHTRNRLYLRLLPDDESIHFALETWGVVDSNTQANKGPVTVFNQGRSEFQARKLIHIRPLGLEVARSKSSASSNVSTIGMQTDYDNIPLVREIVRSIADRQQQELAGQAKAESEALLRRQVAQRFDAEVSTKLADGQQAVYDRVVGKLTALNLQPHVVGLSSTDHNAEIRYRVASDSQLGSHTPRPQAPANSMLAAQVHETALNNFVERLELEGRTMTVAELASFLAGRLGIQQQPNDESELLSEVTLEFAKEDCLRIFLDDDQVKVSLRLAKLQHDRRVWKDFAVTASYRPEVQGLTFNLLRDGHISLAGRRLRFRDQISLRAIFSKVFSDDRPLVIALPGLDSDPRWSDLRVSQLSIDDGWFGAAVSARHPASQTAVAPSGTQR